MFSEPPHRTSLRLGSVLLVALFAVAFWPSKGLSQAANPYIVVDANHKKILAQNEADRKVPVASLTKVATALVALDWTDSRKLDKNAIMTVPASAGVIGGANPLGLRPGDQITVRDAVYAAMLASDNVSAETLADHFGRQMLYQTRGRDPVGAFVGQMNALAANLGMDKTQFVNPHGLDHERKYGTSTAMDMARLMIYGLRNPSFNFIIAQTSREISYTRAGQPMGFTIKNTNQLLGKFGVDGGKTGSTRRAGDCLIVTARKPDKFIPIAGNQKRRIPYRLVTVVLGSPDRFGQSRALLDQGWRSYDAWMNTGMRITGPEELLKIPN